MQDLEPFFRWRDEYNAADDERSPLYGRTYSEFEFTDTIYNYYIHPQWDNIGSSTLYLKVLFADYHQHFAIIELIGEWNDAVHNDIMFLKRELIDEMIPAGIYHYILIGENILNYHGDDDSYYEEWKDDLEEYDGWVVLLNMQDHVLDEMRETQLDNYLHFGELFNDINWRPHKPRRVFAAIEGVLSQEEKRLD
ncbi:MAG: hypothetical protein ACRBG0_16230 [Lewinella sp.]|jgi:hypothetical protein|uniref:hypothetical protein n=1 Tax=Lewinella sp. TaxID=2004506 RepID=UPI003D6B80DB